MNWFYAVNRERKGPVSEEVFRDLVGSGQVKHDTLVWNEEMEKWEPYSKVQAASVQKTAPPAIPTAEPEVTESAAPAVSDPSQKSPGGIVCAGCGEQFHFDSVTRVGEVYSCHFCRPTIESSQVEADVSGDFVSPEALEASDYESPLGACVGRGIETFSKHLFALLAATSLIYAVRLLFGAVPIIGAIINALLYGVLMGGYWKCFISRARGEQPERNVILSGFGPQLIDLTIAALLWSLIPMLFVVPGLFFSIIGAAMKSGPVLLVGAAASTLGMAFMIYFMVAWMFAIPLIADKRLNAWPAMQLSRQMVGKHWWANFGLVVVMGFFLVAPQGVMIYQALPIIMEIAEELGPEFFKNPVALDPERLAPIAKYVWIVLIWTVMYMPLFMSCLAVRYNDIFGRLREE
ncbi:MAG: hypothetical protein ACJASX_004220 [Limisphaerales bacterium]|jgi:hypothetical protein